jgi:hypothetical protein|tara:strand:+ start:11045 stop:11464 length:420 start_codon:yes stop_codon:yes gene_type:complete
MKDKVAYIAKKTGGIIFEANKDKDDGSQWSNAVENKKQWIIDNVNKGDTVEYELTETGHISSIEVTEKGKQEFQSAKNYSGGRMPPQERAEIRRMAILKVMAEWKIDLTEANMKNYANYFETYVLTGETENTPIQEAKE